MYGFIKIKSNRDKRVSEMIRYMREKDIQSILETELYLIGYEIQKIIDMEEKERLAMARVIRCLG